MVASTYRRPAAAMRFRNASSSKKGDEPIRPIGGMVGDENLLVVPHLQSGGGVGGRQHRSPGGHGSRTLF